MNLCSEGHDEVCYEGRNCPCCYHIADLNEQIRDKDKEIAQLEKDVKDLEDSE